MNTPLPGGRSLRLAVADLCRLTLPRSSSLQHIMANINSFLGRQPVKPCTVPKKTTRDPSPLRRADGLIAIIRALTWIEMLRERDTPQKSSEPQGQLGTRRRDCSVVRAIAHRGLVPERIERQDAFRRPSVDQHLLFVGQQAARGSILTRMYADGNLVAGLEQGAGPAAAGQHGRRAALDRPGDGVVAGALETTLIVTWGAIQTYSLTVPDRVTVRWRSYIENE